MCKCKPRGVGEAPVGEGDGDDAEDFPSETAKSFSELIGLCHAWEKDVPRASLALEGGLCCLRSLQSRPSKASSAKGKGKEGGDEVLDGALAALSAAVSRFFENKRKAGFSSKQVMIDLVENYGVCLCWQASFVLSIYFIFSASAFFAFLLYLSLWRCHSSCHFVVLDASPNDVSRFTEIASQYYVT